MGRIPVFRVLFFVLAIVFLFPSHGHGQRTLGVVWDIPDNSQEAIAQLDRFEKLKIRYLELDEQVSDQLWQAIKSRGFNVYIQVPVKFPVVETFSDAESSLAEIYQQYLAHYAGREVEAIGAFAYGQTHDEAFAGAVAPYARQLRNALLLPIYFKDWNYGHEAVNSLFDFSITRIQVGRDFQSMPDSSFQVSHGFLYNPSPEMTGRVAPLKWFFQKTEVSPDAVLFFHSEWLLHFLEQHRSAEQILVEQATYQNAVFPLPYEASTTGSPHSTIVLILLLLWGIVALSYNFIPMYRHSLFRFFLSHTFFIEDVMERHIRSVLPSLLLLIQHAILGGIFIYCAANVYLSISGIDIFYHYFPEFNIFGTGYFSFFIWGFTFTLFFEIICLLWLYLANPKVKYFSQVSILYSWPFHINLVITTAIVTLLMSDGNTPLISLCFILFLIVFFSSFPLTAYDSAQQLTKYRWLHAVGTLGIYCLLLAGGVAAILASSSLMNILDLVVSIS